MIPPQRRWQSIHGKLPLMASGLVLLTALILCVSAWALLQRELVDATGKRLHTAASLVAQMLQVPSALRGDDSTTRAGDAVLRDFLARRVSAESATAVLRLPPAAGDTQNVFAALLDTLGHPILSYRRGSGAPAWPAAAVATREVTAERELWIGPLELVDGHVATSTVRPLRAIRGGQPESRGRLIGYVAQGRTITGRGARRFENIVGSGVSLVIGQPGMGVWTDLERAAPTPSQQLSRDSIVELPDAVAASARIAGTPWMVWLSQSKRAVLAPARSLLWTLVPLGLLIALLGASVMWRVAHRITQPIAHLTDAVEEIAKDANALPQTSEMPTAVRGGDEVTRLRYAFDRMAARVAERETLEAQLRHAQKMEAVGTLAGGIAHDFNNLLTAIRSYADLLIQDMPQWDARRGDVEEIRKAALRASGLTAQLLAFSRKQMLQPRVLDTPVVLGDVRGLLGRLLIEDIQLAVDAPAEVWPVRADRGQLEQVIVNLAVNARDAMPNGGTLSISARNETVAARVDTRDGPMPPGEYVAIRVADSGDGMDAATQGRLFEPFFTTKGVGRGTGLGLATVHGIVAQSGGWVTVASAVNAGTTFTVYLPRAQGEPARDAGVSGNGSRGENETILLVEDEPAVRTLARRVLARAGFRVLEATTPADALRLAQAHAAEIRLVLSDVVMPEMSGPAMAAKVVELCPSARVLYISGYHDEEVIGRGLSGANVGLLQKPFSAQELVDRVRSALDAA